VSDLASAMAHIVASCHNLHVIRALVSVSEQLAQDVLLTLVRLIDAVNAAYNNQMIGNGDDGNPPRGTSDPLPLPRLKLLHGVDTIQAQSGYGFWLQKSTDEIVDSLQRGSRYGQLEVKADGTVIQGNTRIHILKLRGFDVDALPRVSYASPTVDDLKQ
jgi:hypothetical protein